MLTAVAVGISLSPLRMDLTRSARGHDADVNEYMEVVERMRAGQTFYEASAAALTGFGYPTLSPFNWRTPAAMTIVASLPEPGHARWILGALGVSLFFLAYLALRSLGGSLGPGLGLILLSGTILPGLVGILYVQSVLWAGLLVGLSAAALGAGYRKVGIAAGIAAPLFREFAIAWVAVCLFFSLWERRRGEAIAWAAGVAGFCGMLTWHAIQVNRHILPESFAQPEGWFQFGGLPFVLSTFQMGGYLLLAPHWVTALFFAACMTGLVGWRSPFGRRVAATMIGFVVSFWIVGLPYNQYWGLVFAPLACLAVARAPRALRELWAAAELPSLARAEAGEPLGA